ncbi:MAG: ABC transporter ATP-binding protein [Acidimicrobiales bacterium]
MRTWLRTSHGVVRPVDGVSFSLAEGRTLGVTGESGAGKSVLCRSLLSVFPGSTVRAEGEVLIDGVDLRRVSPRERSSVLATKVGVVFQDPETALDPAMRAGRQVAEALGLSARAGAGRFRRGEQRERAVELLAQVGVPEPERRARQYPHQLSTGLAQRVCIAIALAAAPRLVIADEPTSALDRRSGVAVLELISRYQRAQSAAVVLVSHDIGLLADRTDEVMVLYAGVVVEHGPSRQVLSSPRMPYTQGLVASALGLERPPHSRLPVIDGEPPDPARRLAGCAFAPRCASADPRCATHAPRLQPVAQGHLVACWKPLSGAIA